MKSLGVVALLLAGLTFADRASFARELSGQTPQPPQQEEFVPIDELPPEDQVPAAPLVVAAYAFIWVAFLAYAFTLVRRVRNVEREIQRLERRGTP